REGRIVGRGHTQPPGGAHAEVMALLEAGEAARGGTLYATLEPCFHHGRTPPCVDAILAAGIAEVRYAIVDPDENVAGQGDANLRAAGVTVTSGDGAAEAEQLMEGYLHHRRTGRPLVIVKFAASLDGRIAAASGDSRWVSGPEARAWAHRERTRIDAIAVGSNTVIVDNPELTARPEGVDDPHQPLRVVLDSHGRVPATARVLGTGSVVITTRAATEGWRSGIAATGAEVVEVATGVDGRIDLGAMLDVLGARGVLTLLVEGGGTLLGSLFDQRLVGRLYAVMAPVIIGASSAPSAVAGEGVQRMREAPRLRDLTVARLGQDTLIAGVPVWPDATDEGGDA
ncbi:MAG: bifunctional diaminohydroxyphosphoribosylaminopyrimidine deaminase/5-amino-6-(5-phosphoribosylamino)uracil reductase RibD, partial [Chloroflexi bacterium]|nr:bifunctional diaminohydroxyphosphoribosylaminopyrimidine deaminase/5-amino-6-(5-phosphoribosylamino)uracil reductase RibD [Chloroflexota bacterium]